MLTGTKIWATRLSNGRARVTISQSDTLVRAEVAVEGSEDPLTIAQEHAAFVAAKGAIQNAADALDRYIEATRK